jgi:multidrug transporter EmrE-like cation transporter
MSVNTVVLVAASLACSATAQLLMKIGMSSAEVQHALAGGFGMRSLWQIALNIPVAAGISLYGFGAIMWLLVLSRMDLSKAYPFMALGLCATALLGHVALAEPMPAARIFGIFVIVVGMLILSSS